MPNRIKNKKLISDWLQKAEDDLAFLQKMRLTFLWFLALWIGFKKFSLFYSRDSNKSTTGNNFNTPLL
jgi:hypothetical protein